MGPEANLSKRVMRLLSHFKLDPHRVESLTENGFPDICHVRGLLELKALRTKFLGGTPSELLPKVLRKEQYAFWQSWWKRGGRGHVLVYQPLLFNYLLIGPSESNLFCSVTEAVAAIITHEP
jgi:hypothetical protein